MDELSDKQKESYQKSLVQDYNTKRGKSKKSSKKNKAKTKIEAKEAPYKDLTIPDVDYSWEKVEKISDSYYIFWIDFVPAKRMTIGDTRKPSKEATRYFEYCNRLRSIVLDSDFDAKVLTKNYYHLIFNFPLSKSWSKKKKLSLEDEPYNKHPDKDNIEKGFLDALLPSYPKNLGTKAKRDIASYMNIKDLVDIDDKKVSMGSVVKSYSELGQDKKYIELFIEDDFDYRALRVKHGT